MILANVAAPHPVDNRNLTTSLFSERDEIYATDAALFQLRSPLALALLLFLIAFLVRVAFIVAFQTYQDLSRIELERVAISLATTGVFGNPYAIPTGPTAHVSPGYPLILAAIFKGFGTGIAAEIVKQLLSAAITALSCALLPFVSEGLRMGRRAGIIAGLVCAFYPTRPLVQVGGDWEAPYITLALMLISVLAVRLWKRQRLTPSNAVIHGVCWGICLLFVSAMLPVFAALLIAGAYFCRPAGLKKYAAFVAIELAVVAVALAPWAIRNDYALGSPIIGRSNAGLELHLSNNDEATPDQRVNYLNGLFQRYHPLLSPSESMKVRQMGEVAYNRQAMREATQWIRTHPKRFLELTLGRIRCFWFYIDPTSPFKTLYLWLTSLLALVGLYCTFRAARLAGIAISIVLLVYPLPNYLVHVGLRQEAPLEWLTALLSAFAVLYWLELSRAKDAQLCSETADELVTAAASV